MMRRADETSSETGSTVPGGVGDVVSSGMGMVREKRGGRGVSLIGTVGSRFDNAGAATYLSKTRGQRKVVTTMTSDSISGAGFARHRRGNELANP